MDNNSKKIFADSVLYTGRNSRPAACLIWPAGHPRTANNPQPAAGFSKFGNVKRISIKLNIKSDKNKNCRFFTKSRFLHSQMIVFCKWVANHTQNHSLEMC